MNFLKNPSLVFFFFAALVFPFAHSAEFRITNKCAYPVWAAAVPGGGKPLKTGESWNISAPAGTTAARIWARTKCQFDGAGKGKCETGDCKGLLECKDYGVAPNTLAEYTIGGFANKDYIDISNIEGFNVPMEFSSNSTGCTRVIKCSDKKIVDDCPNELKVPGGCNGPCPAIKTEEHCCKSGKCGPTKLSKFFKDRCPDAYSYPKDDLTSLFTCSTGTNYKVIFCP